MEQTRLLKKISKLKLHIDKQKTYAHDTNKKKHLVIMWMETLHTLILLLLFFFAFTNSVLALSIVKVSIFVWWHSRVISLVALKLTTFFAVACVYALVIQCFHSLVCSSLFLFSMLLHLVIWLFFFFWINIKQFYIRWYQFYGILLIQHFIFAYDWIRHWD